MLRACDFCGTSYEPKTARSKFCSDNHRTDNGKYKRAGKPVPALTRTQPAPPTSTDVADRLERELRELGVFDAYEAGVVLLMAAQLDSGRHSGAAFVSLSKEVDRRVDALRLKAERPDDPAVLIRERFEEKRLRLVTDETSGRQVR